MASKEIEMTLKLVMDRSSKKVLYAEARKDFIDFLIGLLQIPVGSIMKLLTENGVVSGSLDSLFRSVSNLETSHFHSIDNQNFLMRPSVGSHAYKPPLLLQNFACWNSSSLYSVVMEGHVKSNCNYMVTDDLAVSPMSSISVFALLQKFNIKNIGSLEEKTVKIDLKKALVLVKASMASTTALTDVFVAS